MASSERDPPGGEAMKANDSADELSRKVRQESSSSDPNELEFSLGPTGSTQNSEAGRNVESNSAGQSHASEVHHDHETIQFVRDTTPLNEQEKQRTIQAVAASSTTTQPILPCRFGDYMLDRVLGRGGMGVVYLAHQVNLDRQVAIKMIRSGCLANKNEIQRFYAEARSAARLDHPNIVSVYQCGEIDGNHYFSMDYVQGSDLAKKIIEGPLSPKEAARYTRDIARTIAHAHAHGIVHRDLKPANVLLDDHNAVVITDFGLAKLLDSEGGLTQSGAAMGTPSYMSPEQASGDIDSQSYSTDVYSVGAILFALLTGKPPFENNTVIQTIMDVIQRPAPDVSLLRSDVPKDLETIVAKCLSKDAASRYKTADALADELDRYLSDQPIESRPISRFYRFTRWFIDVPLIAAVLGYRNAQPKEAHRWVQRAILGAFVLAPIFLIMTWRMQRWWNEERIPSHVVIAGGMDGGVYNDISHRLAEGLGKAFENDFSVLDTAGSDENLVKLLSGQCDLALLQATSVRSDTVAVVAPLYFEAVHLVVRSDKGIENVGQLRGHRVGIGLDESGTRTAALSVLESVALSTDDVDEIATDWTTIQSDETIDAVFVMIKPGFRKMVTLLDSPEFRLLPIPQARDIALDEPAFNVIELSERDYHNLPVGGIETLATTAFLAARVNAPNRLVQESLRAVYAEESHFQGLIPPKRAANWRGLPFHSAARRYYETILK